MSVLTGCVFFIMILENEKIECFFLFSENVGIDWLCFLYVLHVCVFFGFCFALLFAFLLFCFTLFCLFGVC